MERKFHINLFILSRGHHEASWRNPQSMSRAFTDINYYVNAHKRQKRTASIQPSWPIRWAYQRTSTAQHGFTGPPYGA